MRVIFEKRHTKNTTYTNCYDCALARAIREQHPKFNLEGVGGSFVNSTTRPFIGISTKDWNGKSFCDLRDGIIEKVVLDISIPEYDNEISKVPQHIDITSELAVLPINETSDLIVKKELITN